MPAFMPHVDYGWSLVATAPSPPTSGTSVTVTAGQGTNFPDPALVGSYRAAFGPAATVPSLANTEQVLVTAKSTDTFTITRAQGTTSARTVLVGDLFYIVEGSKAFQDIEGALDNAVNDFRLTLTSGTPVTKADVTGATTVYCSPYKGNRIALYNTTFSAWLWDTSAEFSIALGTLVNAQGYDVFCYDNAGVPTLELDEWANGTITMTIAGPAVVTWTGHGMSTGMSITFTTTGALPTGVTANTQYWITVIDANTFKLSTSPANVAAGTFITTSGSQSGTHTGHQPQAYFVSGTYATTRPTQNGVYVKSTNGTTVDASRRYLGSFLTTSTTTTEDSALKRDLYNYYNRVPRVLNRQESTSTWTYTTNTIRQANGSSSNQLEVMIGVAEAVIDLVLYEAVLNSAGAVNVGAGIGEDSTSTVFAWSSCTPPAGGNQTLTVRAVKYPTIGRHFYSWNESSEASGTTTWHGNTTFASGALTCGLSGTVQ